MSTSAAARLRARGVNVTLRGKSYPLIFDFDALCALEEEMGGIDVYAQRMTKKPWRHRAVRAGMVAALSHTGMERAQVVSLMQLKDVGSYMIALSEALTQALPQREPDEDPKGEGNESSPGAATTTSRRSSSAAVRASSGG